MGAIAPMGTPPQPKRFGDDAPKSPPHELCYVAVIYGAKRYSKNYECVIMKVKKVHALISA